MKKINIISLRVIALFVIAMLVSFIPELIPDFFGDWNCNGCTYGGDYRNHMPQTHWGYRHWLFFTMGVSLFIIQIVDIINYIDKK